ncbi:hypothetical protein HNY73_021320 [Argiope bruennichi]|uniref:Uncharacterized protein n=1 Tax=Argiope bruennichi TaxID=94029 RepID=A0A8T0DZB2_ARGBR|nr:hypothetical protein HNY73_021320 [Argiope bruennichi]
MVKARRPVDRSSYSNAAKKTLETRGTQIMPIIMHVDNNPFQPSYAPSEICPKSESFIKDFSPSIPMEDTTQDIPQCKAADTSQNLASFKTVINRKKYKKNSKPKDNKTMTTNMSNPRTPVSGVSFGDVTKTINLAQRNPFDTPSNVQPFVSDIEPEKELDTSETSLSSETKPKRKKLPSKSQKAFALKHSKQGRSAKDLEEDIFCIRLLYCAYNSSKCLVEHVDLIAPVKSADAAVLQLPLSAAPTASVATASVAAERVQTADAVTASVVVQRNARVDDD